MAGMLTPNPRFDNDLGSHAWQDWFFRLFQSFTYTTVATLNFPNTLAGAISTLTVTIPGAAAGDVVLLGPPAGVEAGFVWSGYVSAADTVTIRMHNTTAGAIDPVSADWRVTVLKFNA